MIDGFVVDLYCHSAKLVIEVDDKVREDQAAYDAERDRIIRDCNLRILRVKNEDVFRNRPAVLAKIRDVIRKQLRLPVPSESFLWGGNRV